MRAQTPARRSRWRKRHLLYALCAGFLIWFWQALPEPLFRAPLSPVLRDIGGELLTARIAADGQWRFTQDAPPPARYQQALPAFEDQRFHYHPGVDPLALLRALRSNVRAGKTVSGASTLSMQVIRLARGNPPRTLGEKLHEMLLALRLELRYSKAEILALYAQHAPFGGNTVGLDTAAWRYFHRRADALSWAEVATLAVLPNSPALIHPGRGRELLRAKRDRLLKKLHAEQAINDLDLRLALAEPLPEAPQAVPKLATHLLDSLLLQGTQQAATAGRNARANADQTGAVLHSTIDIRYQQQMQDVLARAAGPLQSRGVHNAALLLIDNRSQTVSAYVGNLPDARQAQAVDIIRAPRSSGSILKPLLYALLLEDGRIVPSTLVPDVPTQIMGYVPENFDREYRGAVRADDALARSLNIPAVRLLREYGVQRFHVALQNIGFSTLFRAADEYGLTLILGGAETTLWDVGQAYANLAAQSLAQDPHYRRLQVLQSPAVPAAHPAAARADYSRGAAWLTLEALKDVNRPGVEQYWRSFSSSREVSWKTGTSFGLRDAWAVAVTPQFTLAVWAGNADGSGVAELSGTSTAAPILFDALNRLPDSGGFAEPFEDLRLVEVCASDGYRPQQDCPVRSERAPKNAHFEKPSPYQQRVHLDAQQTLRVHGQCAPVHSQRAVNYFVLPPAMEHFWKQSHADYQTLPPWRRDCVASAPKTEQAIGLLYPPEHARIYIPADLDGEKSRLVLQAVHRRRDARLYWHLDDHYLGDTRGLHQQALLITPGEHRLTLVDDEGLRLARSFVVLGKE